VRDWTRENPVLTFILVLVLLGTVGDIVTAIWGGK
jgi:hypothetical protein